MVSNQQVTDTGHKAPGKQRRLECSHANWRPGKRTCPDCGKKMKPPPEAH